jgi:hypothetical protein
MGCSFVGFGGNAERGDGCEEIVTFAHAPEPLMKEGRRQLLVIGNDSNRIVGLGLLGGRLSTLSPHAIFINPHSLDGRVLRQYSSLLMRCHHISSNRRRNRETSQQRLRRNNSPNNTIKLPREEVVHGISIQRAQGTDGSVALESICIGHAEEPIYDGGTPFDEAVGVLIGRALAGEEGPLGRLGILRVGDVLLGDGFVGSWGL